MLDMSYAFKIQFKKINNKKARSAFICFIQLLEGLLADISTHLQMNMYIQK